MKSVTAAESGTLLLGGDLPVHRVGLGAMRITGPGVFGPPMDRGAAIAVLRRACELGVTLVDTADSYGPYVSETLIAEALYPYPPQLVIATKGGFERPGPNLWQVNGDPRHLRKALDGSLRRLRLERIPLYQLHRIDPAVPEDDQFGFLQEAQRAGKIQHVGLSEAGIDQIVRARRFVDIVSVQNRYNLIDREWEPMVDYCASERIAFLAWAPLQQGAVRRGARTLIKRIIGRTPWQHDLARVAARHRATRAQISLAWLLRRSPALVPIPGTSRVDHLRENLEAATIRLTNEEFAALS
jgi:pyridoxine 4-dehydrogenase